MKTHRTVLAILAAVAVATSLRAQEHTFAVEVNGVLCGYADVVATTAQADGQDYTLVRETVFAMLSALGSTFNTEAESTFHLDPRTGRCTYHEGEIRQGDTHLAVQVHIEDRRARFVYPLDEEEKTIPLPADVVFENPIRAPHLVRDFVERGVTSATYAILDPREAEVQDTTYTRIGEEALDLAGAKFETLILDRLNEVTGLTFRQWIDVETGMTVQVVVPNSRKIYLADPSVKKRIELANLDETIATRVGVAISDIHAISFMKVRAVLEPTGLRLSREDLNVPGQRFEGTVDGNRVDGVFTIEHPRYDGSGAPPFPVTAPASEELAPFVAREDLIESDDPVLVAHAQRLTADAGDCWDAARRLSSWVADNISYAIPGGIGARKTFDTRAGECGAHSLLLAALCRSVSIPARVVWGCMYVPNFGGAFGQHAWTEVHMGDAGWVPVDATAYEIDFVDSSHLRVGVYQSFSTAINMREMEVLEHRMRPNEAPAGDVARVRLEAYVGAYEHPRGEEPFQVLVSDGGLAVDIPGQLVLGLHEADERGRWYAKLTNRLYCTFPRDDAGEVAALTIHEIVEMRRRAGPDEVGDDVPAALRPYLGTYRFAAIRQDFTVLYDDGRLAIHDPTEDRVVHFEPTDEPGRWIDEFDKNAISFVTEEDGTVSAMLLDAANRFERRRVRQDPGSAAADDVKAVLADLHRAVAEADGERYFGHLATDAILLGTDVRERWTVAALRTLMGPTFESDTGWTTLPVEQHAFVAEAGDVAWFDERLESSRFGEMRGTGVLRRMDGRWRVVHYNTVFPLPNEMFADLVAEIAELGPETSPPVAAVEADGPAAAVRAVLADFHLRASRSERERYFAHFAPDAVYFGTDANERFTVEQLRDFTAPAFDAGLGWTTLPIEQHVQVAPDGKVAWFDERLQSSKYGEMRGSGVLVARNGTWKIVQYHLALPIPNELVPGFVASRGDIR